MLVKKKHQYLKCLFWAAANISSQFKIDVGFRIFNIPKDQDFILKKYFSRHKEKVFYTKTL